MDATRVADCALSAKEFDIGEHSFCKIRNYKAISFQHPSIYRIKFDPTLCVQCVLSYIVFCDCLSDYLFLIFNHCQFEIIRLRVRVFLYLYCLHLLLVLYVANYKKKSIALNRCDSIIQILH